MGYLPQLLAEIGRLEVDVAWLANNCSEASKAKLGRFKRTVGIYSYDGPFHNCLRQYPLDILKSAGYDWAIQWDADETWEPSAPKKLRKFLKDQALIQVRMAHAWEKNGKDYLTTDWAAERDRIYNLKYRWVYTQRVVAGATCLDGEVEVSQVNLWMIHWGYSTDKKRQQHKVRWNLNHGNSVGKNPYGMWDTITQEGYEPKLEGFESFISKLK